MSLEKAEEFVKAAQRCLEEGRELAEAMELRHSADYNDSHVPPRRASRVVRSAAEFVSRVKEVSGNV